jgi:hypothetical protein
VRIKSRWNQKERARSIQETASALGFIMWRIAQNALLSLENEGFQTDTQVQRLDVIEEFLAFLLHVVDRLVYDRMDQTERSEFMNALARKLSDFVQDNARDFLGQGDHRAPFIRLVNERMDVYSEFAFREGEPGFSLRRYLGDRVTGVMGARDSKWIDDQVMDIEVPEALNTLNRGLGNLLPQESELAG